MQDALNITIIKLNFRHTFINWLDSKNDGRFWNKDNEAGILQLELFHHTLKIAPEPPDAVQVSLGVLNKGHR